MTHKKSMLFATLLSTTIAAGAIAANVPEGTKLAEDQTYTYRMGDETPSIDPQLMSDVSGFDIARDLFEGLYNQDADGNVVPGVALSHEVSEDNMTYTFKLRDNAKWSDGNPVTASDFVFAWQRAVDPELASDYAWYIEIMLVENASEIIAGEMPPSALGVEAPDDHTLVVRLSEPVPYLDKMVTSGTTFPTPRWAIEEHGSDWVQPGNMVSNGAYVLTEHVPRERYVRERNPMYWDNENTVIDKVVGLIIGDEVQALTRWKAGELDYTEVPTGQYGALSEQFPNSAVSVPELCSYYIVLNQSDSGLEAMKDVRVRKALSYAIDRDVIVNQVLQGGQTAAYNFTPITTAGFDAPEIDYASWTQAERDAKAVELLAEAGYGPDNPLEFEYLYNTADNHEQFAVVVSQMWKQKLGAQVTLANQEWKVFLENRLNQNYEVARGGWCGDYNEASTFLDLVTTDSVYNQGKYSNPRVDELMAQAKLSQNPNPLYTEVEQIIAEEMAIIPAYFYARAIMLDESLKGWPYNNVQANFYAKDFYKVAE